MSESYIPEKFFESNRFLKRTCPKCSSIFWSQDPHQELCGDAPCVEYSFIGKDLAEKKYSLPEMRELYQKYFESKDHTILHRYPVIPRWRDDIYLTIASIAVFQPHVTSGEVEPPANPLVISQPCIRLNDLDAVGKSGRHLSTFEMMAHHAFNTEDNHIYWIEEIVAYCHEFFAGVMKIPSEMISYKEKPWSGGGNAGAAVEVLTSGLEVATLVFMDLVEDENGQTEIEGKHYSKMPLRIVDTGYGLERMVWLLTGTPSVYQTVYPELLEIIMKSCDQDFPVLGEEYRKLLYRHAELSGLYDDSGSHTRVRTILVEKLRTEGFDIDFETLSNLMEPLEKVYTVADHTKTIALMFHDGVVPSNLKAGYLARLVVRRTLRLLEELGSRTDIKDLVAWHLQNFDILDPDEETLRRVLDMVDSEVKKYRITMEKGSNLVGKFANQFRKAGSVSLEKVIEFYDTYGIHPHVVERILKEQGIDFRTPPNFYSLLAGRNMEAEKKTVPEAEGKVSGSESREISFSKDTRKLYYEDEYLVEFEAHVLFMKDNLMILDKTAFYPEGGGQPADNGTLTTENTSVEVVSVWTQGNVIVHVLNQKNPDIRVGDRVLGRINWECRFAHMQHHTATHLLIAAAKRTLGNHIWQAGSHLGEEEARLDISHYKRISAEELKEIERLANYTVTQTLSVEKSELYRNDAEKKYGLKLYQGGVPKSNKIRVVRVLDFDIQACGGTHCRSTGHIGMIKILRTTSIQDGVERLFFSAGSSALRKVQEMEGTLKFSADILSVEPQLLPATVERFFNEWKEQKKRIEELEKKYARSLAENLSAQLEELNNLRLGIRKLAASKDELVFIAEEITKGAKGIVLALGNDSGNLVVAISRDLVHDRKLNASTFLRLGARALGGGGGGSPFMAMGGGSKKEGMDEALALIRAAILEKD